MNRKLSNLTEEEKQYRRKMQKQFYSLVYLNNPENHKKELIRMKKFRDYLKECKRMRFILI